MEKTGGILKKKNDFQEAVIGTTTENVARYGHAAAEYIKGYRGNVSADGKIIKKGLKQVAESKVNSEYEYQNLKQQAGFSAEIHYVDKENAQSIIKGDNQRIARSNDLGRGNDPVYDVLSVDENGDPTWGAQMKFCGRFGSPDEVKKSAENLVEKLAGKKWERYRGNKVLIPTEQYSEAKKYAENASKKCLKQAEEFRNQGNIEKAESLEQKASTYKQVAADLQDSQITSKEALFLREHPKLATAKYVTKTAHMSGIENAKAAAVIAGSISVAQNVVSVIRHDKEIDDVVVDIGKDVIAGSATAYVIGYSDTAIRSFMSSSQNSVFANLSKTKLPSMIATTSLQVGKSLLRYANGEIDSIQLIEELGEKGTGIMAASMGAAIGTMIFPGIGSVIGSMVGYMTSSTIYSSCMQVLAKERISGERREKIKKLADTAIESMQMQGRELLSLTKQFYCNRQYIFENCLNEIELSIGNDDLNMFTVALNNIAVELGSMLKFKNFDEFDDFMSDSSSVFVF